MWSKPTEAFVSIDVNSGKYTGKKKQRKPTVRSIWRQQEKSPARSGFEIFLELF